MKKTLSILLAVFALYSCGGSDDYTPEPEPTPQPADPKEYIVSFGFIGEITDMREEPLSRTTLNELYGIQVYSKTSSDIAYKAYAYGLFDDISNIEIKLLDGYTYKFEATMIVDAKSKIATWNNMFYSPFAITSSTTPIGTDFVYSTNQQMNDIRSSYSVIYLEDGNTKDFWRPNIDRYYGSVSEYTPSELKTINIEMKRVSFGLKVIADGISEGKIKIALEDAPQMYIEYPNTEIKDIFVLQNDYSYDNAWTTNDFTNNISFSAIWEKNDGASVPLVSKNITFKRNVLTTITVKVKDTSISNGMNISNETTSMGNEAIVIESGEGINTGIDLQ